MDIKLYNTLSRKEDIFVPIHQGKVGLYDCGPTVYHYAHIGNLRAYVFADILRRTLEYAGLEVTQIINITDVGHLVSDEDEGEDKMEKGARREGKTAQEIADFYTEAFFEDLAKLNIKAAAHYTKATEHIPEQISLIKKLEEKSFTYQTSDGIYFDTSKFPAYGELAQLNLGGQREGARVETNEKKKNAADFALWKFSKPEEHRQQEWPSPWGVGFPGWHIECSAMSMKYLGETFDIHTGGIDHIPVHHTNEIAQSEGATGKKFVKVWMHSGFVNIEGGKMAKSSGDFLRLEILEEKGILPLAYRYWLLTSHYRKTINFTWEAVLASQTAFLKLHEIFKSFGDDTGIADVTYVQKFEEGINTDLNTSTAIASLWDLARDSSVPPADKKATFLEFDKVLGLGFGTFKLPETEEIIEIPILVKNLLSEREIARSKKEWERSDVLRDEIAGMGYKVADTSNGYKISKI